MVALIALFIYASFPLTERDVKGFIEKHAVNQDQAFQDLSASLNRQYDLTAEKIPISGIDLLKERVRDQGIDLTGYFPGKGDDNRQVLKYIQAKTKGHLNLGLDLKGGMHVVLEVDELALIKKGAANVDQEFKDFMEEVKQIAQRSPENDLLIFKREAQRRHLDLLKYFKAHYQEKYNLKDEHIRDNNDLFRYIEKEIDTANLGSLEILRNRVDKFGVSEPDIQKQGRNELLIQLPGVRDPEKALELIQGQAFLEFKLVGDDPDRLKRAIDTGVVPPGFELKNYRSVDYEGRAKEEKLLLRERAELTGENLVTAYVSTRRDTLEPIVNFKFDRKGSRIFSRVTKQYNSIDNPPGRRLAILLDGKVLSAPLIRSHIPRGEGYIEGSFGMDEAKLMSSQLSAGAYPAPLVVKEKRTVGPSLGEDSINKGVKAALLGLIAVVIFMAIYYLLAGVVADFAVCLNIVIIVGTLCLLPFLFPGFKATLTLPGIAGIILTIGMSVDANVLIFERIREEIAAGKRIKRAIAAGYQKAFVTILDANLTTIIAALVLLNPLGASFLPTAGPIKGFALTLTIGIIASMFTALVVTRLIFDLFCLNKDFTKLRMLRFFSLPHLNIIGKWKTAFLISGIFILISIASFVVAGKKTMGIDFRGGILIQRQFTRVIPADKIRNILEGLGLGDSSVQRYAGGKGVIIRSSAGSEKEIDARIKEELGADIDPATYRQRTEEVGPKVGFQLRKQALGAVILAMAAIMAYIWFRFSQFKFALGAILALFHDVIITMGFLAGLFILPVRELNVPIIAALLTIVGYSLNDTIVVFVRIRENLRTRRDRTVEEVINSSINQVLSRTILTSLTTLLVVLFLFLFGGQVINNFAFALVVGVIVGTYSSVFIASPALLFWHRKQLGKRR